MISVCDWDRPALRHHMPRDGATQFSGLRLVLGRGGVTLHTSSKLTCEIPKYAILDAT